MLFLREKFRVFRNSSFETSGGGTQTGRGWRGPTSVNKAGQHRIIAHYFLTSEAQLGRYQRYAQRVRNNSAEPSCPAAESHCKAIESRRSRASNVPWEIAWRSRSPLRPVEAVGLDSLVALRLGNAGTSKRGMNIPGRGHCKGNLPLTREMRREIFPLGDSPLVEGVGFLA